MVEIDSLDRDIHISVVEQIEGRVRGCECNDVESWFMAFDQGVENSLSYLAVGAE